MRLTQSGMPCDIHLIKNGEALFFSSSSCTFTLFRNWVVKLGLYSVHLHEREGVHGENGAIAVSQSCALSVRDPISPGSVHAIFCNFVRGSASEDAWLYKVNKA